MPHFTLTWRIYIQTRIFCDKKMWSSCLHLQKGPKVMSKRLTSSQNTFGSSASVIEIIWNFSHGTKLRRGRGYVPMLFNTLKFFWLIFGQRKTSLVIFLCKRRKSSVVFLSKILFLMAWYRPLEIILWPKRQLNSFY